MNLSNKEQVLLLKDMLVFRGIEEAMISRTDTWHSAVGEEASHTGIFFGLGKDDLAAPHFRGGYGAHFLRGLSLVEVFGEIFNRANSQSKGKGNGLVGSLKHNILPWTTGTLGALFLTATGAALSVKIKKENRVVVMSFGDGSSSRGEFHEALNFASVKKLPIVYVCINNQWAEFTSAADGVAAKNIADRAQGYNIPGVIVDGNDALAVYEAVQEAIDRARKGEGPSLVECKTYRMGGHTVSDKTLYMPKEQTENWKKKDPIKRFREHLIVKSILTEQEADKLVQDTVAEVEESLQKAIDSPRPSRDKEFALSEVYAP